MNKAEIDAVYLNLLRVFEGLMAEGAASRAAIRLGVTQPAVSAALGRLCVLYSDPLFETIGHWLCPATRADELDLLMEEAPQRCRQALATSTLGSEIKGRSIRIGLPDDRKIALDSHSLLMLKKHLPGLAIIFA
ncbi:LysR family transcriptional regulator [Delftia tsuruhatensis]|uniref:LysR family transcriptional regulator n=1 Tax=Delftia tsuruhatensis TaxID=180282 RepID=UPI001F4045A8|nr:LysR family transcriptional regulator [Delftia tsuruhatensis]